MGSGLEDLLGGRICVYMGNWLARWGNLNIRYLENLG